MPSNCTSNLSNLTEFSGLLVVKVKIIYYKIAVCLGPHDAPLGGRPSFLFSNLFFTNSRAIFFSKA